MSIDICVCRAPSHQRLSEDAPRDHPELVVESHNDKFPDVWLLRCSVCGTRWRVSLIPYGGIYGDFDWERMDS